MSPEHAGLIRNTWTAIAPRSAELTEQFYQRLFDIDPAARALFGQTDRAALGRKVVQMLEAIVKVTDEPAQLVAMLAPLGRHHGDHGLNHQHYESGCTALMAALRAVGGGDFGPEAEQAWRELYHLVAAVMERAGTPHRPPGHEKDDGESFRAPRHLTTHDS